jgi:cell division control protein 6
MTDGDNTKLDDQLFAGGDESQIFDRKELLKISHVPDSDRIVGRTDEIENLAEEIRPVIDGSPPNNVLIYGKTGTGKSLVARHVTGRAEDAAETQNVDMETVYVDCSQHNTHTAAVKYIARTLNKDFSGISVPRSGIGTSDYYEYIWEVTNELYDGVVVILDEIDKLGEGNEVLMQFSRANETSKVEPPVGIIGISNKIGYRDEMGQRVKSSLQEREFIFDPYDAEQLRSILENRQDAFVEGAVETGTIQLSAALAAQEHGDARKALEILLMAGELADRREEETVTEDNVREAREWAEMKRMEELLDGFTTHVKIILYALAHLSDNSREDSFTTTEVYERYQEASKHIDMDPLSKQRVYELLDELGFLGVISSEKKGMGRGRGVSLKHELNKTSDIVRKTVLQDPRLDNLS